MVGAEVGVSDPLTTATMTTIVIPLDVCAVFCGPEMEWQRPRRCLRKSRSHTRLGVRRKRARVVTLTPYTMWMATREV